MTGEEYPQCAVCAIPEDGRIRMYRNEEKDE